jgi:hypothetical protein
VQTIARGVFEVIVDQSPFVPEETVGEQETKGGENDLSGAEIPAVQATWRKAVSRKKIGENLHEWASLFCVWFFVFVFVFFQLFLLIPNAA